MMTWERKVRHNTHDAGYVELYADPDTSSTPSRPYGEGGGDAAACAGGLIRENRYEHTEVVR